MKEFAVRELTLGQVFDTSVEAFPLREAVVHPGSGVRWTWRELSERVDAAARGLMAIGVGEGEKIALWAPNCPQWIVFMVRRGEDRSGSDHGKYELSGNGTALPAAAVRL